MNWGNKLLITFIVFGTGMSFLVYRSFSTNFDLVEKDYYKKEISYQQIIDGTRMAAGLSAACKIIQTEQGILAQLPEEMNNKIINGEIWFYCAYNAKYDKKIALTPDNNGRQLIVNALLVPGDYTVKISWKEGNTGYYMENKIVIV